jgi:hypothetical protein
MELEDYNRLKADYGRKVDTHPKLQLTRQRSSNWG